ncbi:Hypothetical predicted protein [Olea europaea subsp. europaea]|uniref:Uncharacterized protein n=1 Tax=Olea europaea subsp. europaea TaxID=158383 RepID=A0A8S0TY95_OLEEU|nr:Hypothetical predicted protein [Olea europaea subsp. europaea]
MNSWSGNDSCIAYAKINDENSLSLNEESSLDADEGVPVTVPGLTLMPEEASVRKEGKMNVSNTLVESEGAEEFNATQELMVVAAWWWYSELVARKSHRFAQFQRRRLYVRIYDHRYTQIVVICCFAGHFCMNLVMVMTCSDMHLRDAAASPRRSESNVDLRSKTTSFERCR